MSKSFSVIIDQNLKSEAPHVNSSTLCISHSKMLSWSKSITNEAMILLDSTVYLMNAFFTVTTHPPWLHGLPSS